MAVLDRAEAQWMLQSIHYEPDIHFVACVTCSFARPVAPGHPLIVQCDRIAGTHNIWLNVKNDRCRGYTHPFGPEIEAAIWAANRLDGLNGIDYLVDALKWNWQTRRWE